MSVINTMLKDLERRGVDCENSDDKILGGLSASSALTNADERAGNLYIVSLVSVILILTVIVAVYFISPYQLVASTNESPETPVERNQIQDGVDQTATSSRVEIAQDYIVRTTPVVTQTEKKVVTTPVVTQTKKKVVAAPVVAKVEQKAEAPVVAMAITRKAEIQAVEPQQAMTITKAVHSDSEESAIDEMQVVNKRQREASDEEKSQQAYVTALTLYNKGRTQRSKAYLQEAINFSSSNRDAYRLLSVIYLEDGRAGLASEVIEQGLSVHLDDQELLRLYLQALVQNEKYNEAVALMGQRLRLTGAEDIGYLAGLHQKNNDHLNAVKFYSQALRLKPTKSIWWMGQGISLERLKKYDEAMVSYQQSISTGQLTGKLAQYPVLRIDSIKQFKTKSVS